MMRRDAWVPGGPGAAPLRRLDLAGGRASINQRRLRRDGLAGWQAPTTAALLAAWELTATPGAFLDVGANAGVYALLCRLLWPSMGVVAFEPSPATVDAGRRWARANRVEVAFEPVAVSDAEGRGTLHLSARSDASHSLVAGFRDAAGAAAVDLVTLDGYAARTGIAPTVVKIDVESHEPAVLAGARATLARHRPVIVMEVLGGDASAAAHAQLAELGYEPHDLGGRDRLYWPGGLPAAWPQRVAAWAQAVDRCTPPGPPVRPRWRRAAAAASRRLERAG